MSCEAALHHRKATDWLKTTFPKSFQSSLLLKEGITNDIRDFDCKDKLALMWCCRAIRTHTRKASYLKAIIEGNDRFDLNGEFVGTITA